MFWDIVFSSNMRGAQKIGAFKMRGALNALLRLKEEGHLPDHVIAYSSRIMHKLLRNLLRFWGLKQQFICHLLYQRSKQRQQNLMVLNWFYVIHARGGKLGKRAQEKGRFLLPPYDHDDVILGQGTSCYEAFCVTLIILMRFLLHVAGEDYSRTLSCERVCISPNAMFWNGTFASQ